MTRWRFITVTIVCDAPAGVAAPETRPLRDVDSDTEIPVPLASSPSGGPWIPGRSLAGSLRAHLGPDAAVVMGGEPPSRRGGKARQDEDATEPAALRVLGTRVDLPPGGTGLETRRSTAVDRTRGSAAPMTLRSVTRLPAGTEITVWFRLDDDQPRWDILSAALPIWQPVIGGCLTRGFGRAHIADIRHGLLDLDNREHMALWLRSGGPDLAEAITTERLDVPHIAETARTFRWRLNGGLHVGDGQTRAAQKPEVATVVRSKGNTIIPGSTWKGIVRARVEYILTACGQACCLDGSCGNCHPCGLFGYTRPATDDEAAEDGGTGTSSVGARGILQFCDSPIERGTERENLRDRTYVAVDRITGGARDKLLYTSEVVEYGETTLTIRPLGPVPEGGWGLVLMALRDLHDGYVGIGRGNTRGHGTVELADPSALDPLNGVEGEAARLLLSSEPALTGEANDL
jgi:CRISPR/Cas system CSM-associated protein Csm3 (group 7 of RAMP superfamily)